MPKQYDYLIIGAGIIGTSLAAELGSHKKSVLLIEQFDVAGGASGANLGQISLMDRFEDWHMKLALETLEEYRFIQNSNPLGFRQHGGSIVLISEEQRKRARNVGLVQNHRGIHMEILQKEDIRLLEPHLRKPDLLGLAYCPEEGSIDPLALVYYQLDRALSHNVDLLVHTEVNGFVTKGREIQAVVTSRGNYQADVVVNCAGGWAQNIADMLGEGLPIRSHKGTAFVTSPLPPLFQTTLVGGGFLMEDTGEKAPAFRVGTALCQHENGSIVLGQATEQSPAGDRSLSKEGLGETASNLLHYFPVLQSADIIRSWAVSTSYSADGKPVMGFSPQWDNVLTVAGFKGAFSTALAVAKAARDMLLRGQDFVQELRPRDFEKETRSCG